MLALNGGTDIWPVSGATDMRLGKFRLFELAKMVKPNPYNGDAFAFMSKNRRTLKIVRYEHHKLMLYDISYERGYKFMKPVWHDGKLYHQLDFKYLVALLGCPERKNLEINVN